MTDFKKGDRVKFTAGIYIGTRENPLCLVSNLTFTGVITDKSIFFDSTGKNEIPVAIVCLDKQFMQMVPKIQAVPIRELKHC